MVTAPSLRPGRSWSRVVRHYLVAALSVFVAIQIDLLLRGKVDPSLPLLAAIMLCSWQGGLGPGLTAAALSVMPFFYYFVPPIESFEVSVADLPYLGFFVLAALFVSWLSDQRRRAERALASANEDLERRVQERTRDLQESNRQLVAEMAERRRAEESYAVAQAELTRAMRLTTVGELSASISHEINQPLAAVVTYADACHLWLSASPPNVAEAQALLGRIVREGTRASEVVQRIRAMFRKSLPERQLLEIREVVQEAVELILPEARRTGVEVVMEIGDSLPPVEADRVQLQQVLVNLLLNGMEAMAGIEDRPRLLRLTCGKETGGLCVAVTDSGKGFPPEDARRIFDPFVTTKTGGTGMGLSISRTIIESHRGRIWAESGAGGACFQFFLPEAHPPGAKIVDAPTTRKDG